MSRRSLIGDDTVSLLLEGYGWLPNLRRRSGGEVVRTRVLGLPTVVLCGPEAAEFFYDDAHVRRHGAIPELIRGTVFGDGGVQTLDGRAHQHRKAMFTGLQTDDHVQDVVERTGAAWDEAMAEWSGAPVVLFDAASRALTRGVCGWAGVPVAEDELAGWAADLIAMVDGLASLGPRQWRARVARGRRQRHAAELLARARAGRLAVPPGSPVAVVAGYSDVDGAPLRLPVAAVELLNLLRPTVAVSWFVAYAGHALYRWPAYRARLADGDHAFVAAFAQEVRRFYPFAPFVGGLAARDLSWRGEAIPAGTMVLLDIYGQHHHPDVWPEPYRFRPERFLERPAGAYDLIPQGGGDPDRHHRCPGDALTVALIGALTTRVARLDHQVPDQDLTISLRRVPARVASGFVVQPA